MLCATAALAQDPAPEDGIIGVWLTEEKGGKIEMFRCGDKYCGKTVWIDKAANPDGMDARDKNNPKPEKRDRKIVGTTIFWNLAWDPDDRKWVNGYVYDPSRGKTFRCKAWLTEGGHELKLRGFMGVSVLGSTTTWTRVE